MRTVTFTQFRRNASSLITDVEKGEIVRILRHGRPVARDLGPSALGLLPVELQEGIPDLLFGLPFQTRQQIRICVDAVEHPYGPIGVEMLAAGQQHPANQESE